MTAVQVVTLDELRPDDVVVGGEAARFREGSRFTVRRVHQDGARGLPRQGDHISVYGLLTNPTGRRTIAYCLYGWHRETTVEIEQRA